MAKPSKPAYRCHACRRSLTAYTMADERSLLPQVCLDCWQKMTPGERAARSESAAQIDLLRDIRGQLVAFVEADGDDKSQLARIAKTFENIGRILSTPAGEVDDVMGELKKLLRMLQQRVERQNERDGDGDEPWRESLKD